ncbi:hypothetical protein BGZ76_011111 [Entomortierella beljakovae]|nr:hypothetical protein BGZ76_011111 [Entomortierella beljakovae]
MDIDDFDEEMMLDEDDFAAHSPTGEEAFDESGRFGNNRPVNIKIVDKNFFNGKFYY